MTRYEQQLCVFTCQCFNCKFNKIEEEQCTCMELNLSSNYTKLTFCRERGKRGWKGYNSCNQFIKRKC